MTEAEKVAFSQIVENESAGALPYGATWLVGEATGIDADPLAVTVVRAGQARDGQSLDEIIDRYAESFGNGFPTDELAAAIRDFPVPVFASPPNKFGKFMQFAYDNRDFIIAAGTLVGLAFPVVGVIAGATACVIVVGHTATPGLVKLGRWIKRKVSTQVSVEEPVVEPSADPSKDESKCPPASIIDPGDREIRERRKERERVAAKQAALKIIAPRLRLNREKPPAGKAE